LSQNLRGKGSSLGNIFWFVQNETHFAIRQCKLHRATCLHFDKIPACDGRKDGQTDGIAIASTALAVRCKKTKAKFSRLLRHPAWKGKWPILDLCFISLSFTYLLRHLYTYLQPRDPHGATVTTMNPIISLKRPTTVDLKLCIFCHKEQAY